jgi:hypothetical protein
MSSREPEPKIESFSSVNIKPTTFQLLRNARKKNSKSRGTESVLRFQEIGRKRK